MVSLYIPTLNAGSNWIEVLESVKTQTLNPARKVIIDSGSKDDTISLARQYGFEVIEINSKDFNHGKTRQQLVDMYKDVNICVFLTQDAILASLYSIKNIVNAFDDSTVGIAYGRQLPHKNAQPLETHARLFNYPDVSEIVSIKDVAQKGFKVFFCSNSFSAYRRTALIDIGGFPSDSIMGEDAIVAAKMLTAGYKKAYVANATVYHSHSYSFKEEFRRYFDTRVFHEQNRWLIKKYGKPTGEGIRFLKSELKYSNSYGIKIILKSISSTAAKWLGYKSGKYYNKFPIGLLKQLSMHKFYWK